MIHRPRIGVLVIILSIGSIVRMLLPLRGSNFDFGSYLVVADLITQGQNVYANTDRYNYGPIWFWVLYVGQSIAILTPFPYIALRAFVGVILTLADVGIFAILLRRIGLAQATLFFLNPISMFISGQHAQFDNLALLLGMVAVLLFGAAFESGPFTYRRWLALVLLGVSITTKHLLFFFPVWLAAKQPGIRRKLVILAIPILIFLVSFLPFYQEGSDGIIRNVFLYGSRENPLFYSMFLPPFIQQFISADTLWLLLLGLFALVFRTQDPFRSILLYTCILVAPSPALANQYLTIPIAFTAAYMNPFLLLYVAVGTYHLLIDVNGLHFFELDFLHKEGTFYYTMCVCFLTFGFVWLMWAHKIRQAISWLWVEAKYQLGKTLDEQHTIM